MAPKKWNEIEMAHAAQGILPGSGPDEAIYSARLGTCDARLAEGLANAQETDPIQLLRTAIVRGDLARAQEILSTLKGNHAEPAEVLLEQARIAAYEGHWSEAIQNCNETLLAHPTALTQMVVYNVRSIAQYELGDISKAVRDLEKIESLSRLFPHMPSAVFGEILAAKISARQHSPEAGSVLLQRIWLSLLKNGLLNADYSLALLRAEIDLARLAGKPHAQLALASLALAQMIGDGVYEALAYYDFFLRLEEGARRTLRPKLEEYMGMFQKLRSLHDEVSNGNPNTTSARSLALSTPEEVESKALLASFNRLADLEALVLPEISLVIHLRDFEAIWKPDHPQLFAAASALSHSPLTQEDFFGRIWGTQKYSETLHGNLVRSLLARMRRIFKIQVGARKKEICWEGVWVL